MASVESQSGAIGVVVAWSPAEGQVLQVELSLPAGATLQQALERSGLLLPGADGLEASALQVGVWGQLRRLHDGLRDGDRVEVYRPLRVDPKEARRQRQASAGKPRRSPNLP